MITSNQLGVAFQKHINAISHLYYHHFNNGDDLEPITREALMYVDNFQELLTKFRAQEESNLADTAALLQSHIEKGKPK